MQTESRDAGVISRDLDTAMSSPIPYSDRDLDALRQALLRGDTDSRRAAIAQAVLLGAQARPLIPLIADQLRTGLLILNCDLLRLLEAFPDRDLYEAASKSAAFVYLNVHEKGRLFVIGLGDYEDELLTYFFRHWRIVEDPMVREAIGALELAGTEDAADTLNAVLPELSELVATADLQRQDLDADAETSPSVRSLLEKVEAAVLRQRLDQVRQAIRAIQGRRASSAAGPGWEGA
jgi:hypothetical protein